MEQRPPFSHLPTCTTLRSPAITIPSV
ncbi:hypothetical protein E2C01_067310 [Portunus trituberculatus]|uniref:Uncharacterized protein n=1 Tax=Portunus trituberculatus TaxID=210409 RepID=A0A5B7HX42_PORTR|nr:hypothetical protein [Portunus trituberculatus]